MKYKIGQEFYYIGRNNEIIPTKIVGIKYEFDKRANTQTSYLREQEIDEKIKDNKMFLGNITAKELEIRMLEQKYNIKLLETKEVEE